MKICRRKPRLDWLALLMLGFAIGCDGKKTPAFNSETASEANEIRIVDRSTDNDQVHSDIRAIADATYGDDSATILKHTHPIIIEGLGGPAQAESKTQEALTKIKQLGMTLESLTFPEAPTYLETDRHFFVMVPTLIVVSGNGQRVESLNFQFGVQKKASQEWKYIEGSRINQQNVQSLFPDFPSDFEFPKFYRKRI